MFPSVTADLDMFPCVRAALTAKHAHTKSATRSLKRCTKYVKLGFQNGDE